MTDWRIEPRFLLAVAGFYDDIAGEMTASAEEALKESPASLATKVVRVPGALELPMAMKIASESELNIVAMAALGCVIRGETYHFEVVANTCASGIMQVQLQTGIPIGNGVLTVDTMEQARKRHKQKAADAVNAALALWMTKE